MPLKFMTS